MQGTRILLAASLAALVLSVVAITPRHPARAQAAAAAAQAGKNSSSGLTATFYDYDSLGGTLMLLRSDDYNGSGQATYTPSSSHGSTLISTFTADGGWNFNLGQQSLRTVYVTPNVAIDNLQPPGPPAGYYTAVVLSGCFDQSGNVVTLANVVTSSGNCKLGVNFSSGGTTYKLQMNPFPFSESGTPPPSCPAGGCPAEGVATVTCNAVSSGKCVNWTIEPNTTAPHANVANLYRSSSTPKPTGSWVFIGQYYNSFRIDVTNP